MTKISAIMQYSNCYRHLPLTLPSAEWIYMWYGSWEQGGLMLLY